MERQHRQMEASLIAALSWSFYLIRRSGAAGEDQWKLAGSLMLNRINKLSGKTDRHISQQ